MYSTPLLVKRCSWCRLVLFNGSWVPLDDALIADLDAAGRISDGICESCLKSVKS